MIVPFSFAADSLQIIPEAKKPNELWSQVDCVAGTSSGDNCRKWTVRDRYNRQASWYDRNWDTWASFATWIFTWDTIIEYVVYIIKFLSQLWLVVGVMMIIYAWYKYATAVFSGKTPSTDIVKNAIMWVLIVIFAYAIIKALTAAFL